MKISGTLLLLFISSIALFSQPTSVTEANYELAARFSPDRLEKMVFSTSVDPHWLKESNRFWYTYRTTEGIFYFLVDPDRRTKTSLFDNVKIAADMTRLTGDPFDSQHLDIKNLEFIKNETALQFEVVSKLVEVEDKEDNKEVGDTQENEQDRKPKQSANPFQHGWIELTVWLS